MHLFGPHSGTRSREGSWGLTQLQCRQAHVFTDIRLSVAHSLQRHGARVQVNACVAIALHHFRQMIHRVLLDNDLRQALRFQNIRHVNCLRVSLGK